MAEVATVVELGLGFELASFEAKNCARIIYY